MLNTNNDTIQSISSKKLNTPLEVSIPRTLQNMSLLSSEGVLTQTPPSVLTSESGGGIHSSPNNDDRIKKQLQLQS